MILGAGILHPDTLLDENLGRDFLGIPGTNGPRRFEGSWPRFAIENYTVLGTDSDSTPFFRRDPQYNYVANFNWIRSSHELRFGFDLYNQHTNQVQQGGAGAFAGASGGFNFTGGPAILSGGPASNQFNSYAAFLLGLPQMMGRSLQVPDEYMTRNFMYSTYVRDRWNVTPRLTLSYGLRWEYFPMPNRGERGVERYDPKINKMLVCGVGIVPKDCGVGQSKRLFGPRFGIAYRASSSLVFRAGYGITNDPFSLATPFRYNYPVVVQLNLEGVNAFQPAGRLEDGLPPVQAPPLGNGAIDIARTFTAFSIQDKFVRGYIQSWNFTVQKQLPSGFIGQAGYVATRQTKALGSLDLNAGQIIGAGQAGRPLAGSFGRTASTFLITPLGNNSYNSLQATLERRFQLGFHLGASYTWSKVIGWIDNTQDQPQVQAAQYLRRNRTVRNFDRGQNLQINNMWEIPAGPGKRWLSNRGVASMIVGGWQVNNILSFVSGAPFTVTSAATSLNLPGSSQTADQVVPAVRKIGAVGRTVSYFDPLSFRPVTEARFGTAGLNSLRGPGIANWDFSVFRQFHVTERWRIEFRMEAFNFSNTPHFSNPAANVSNLSFNPDGTVRDLGGFSAITSTSSQARDGIDERQFRLGIRIAF